MVRQLYPLTFIFTIVGIYPSNCLIQGDMIKDMKYSFTDYVCNVFVVGREYYYVPPYKFIHPLCLTPSPQVDIIDDKIVIYFGNNTFSVNIPNIFPEIITGINKCDNNVIWIRISKNKMYKITKLGINVIIDNKITKSIKFNYGKYTSRFAPSSAYIIYYKYLINSNNVKLSIYIADDPFYFCIDVKVNKNKLNYNIKMVNSNEIPIYNIENIWMGPFYFPFVIITPSRVIPYIRVVKPIHCGYYVPSQLLSRALGLLMVKLAMDYNVNFESVLPVKLVFPDEYIEYAKRDSVWRLLLAIPVSASFDVIYKLIAIKYFETIYNFSRELLDILGLSNLGDLSVILDDLVALPFIEAFDIGTSYVVKWVCDYLGLPYEYHYDTPTLPAYMVYWLTGSGSLADEVYDVSSYFSFLTSYIYTNSDVVYPRVISSKYNIPRVLSGFAFGLAKGIEFSIVNLNPRRMYVVPEDTFLSCLPYPLAAPVSYVCDSGCLGMFPVPKILSFISFINSYHDSIVSLYGLLWYTLTLLKHGYIQLGLIFDILWTTVQSYIIKALTGVDVL